MVGVAGVLAAAGERDLARVAAQVLAPAGEDDRRPAVVVEEERDEHGRVGAAVDLEGGGLPGVEQDAVQRRAQGCAAVGLSGQA
jgi:hypothetical protein